jgi:hypothetical protein
MLAVGGCPVGVLAHAAWIGDGELRGQMPENALRHIDWVAEERAEEPDGAQLQGVPHAVVITPVRNDGIEMALSTEEARQLLRCRFTGEAAIALACSSERKSTGIPPAVRAKLANVLSFAKWDGMRFP